MAKVFHVSPSSTVDNNVAGLPLLLNPADGFLLAVSVYPKGNLDIQQVLLNQSVLVLHEIFLLQLQLSKDIV